MADNSRQEALSSTENEQNMSNDASSGQSPGVNKFANDGSFMAMFRKRMEEANKQKASSTTDTVTSNSIDLSASLSSTRTDLSSVDTSSATHQKDTSPPQKPSVLSFVGKRRGGKVLKTGAVKKVRHEDEKSSDKQDAWSQYLDEVKKYKSKMCGDEDKTRPLVK